MPLTRDRFGKFAKGTGVATGAKATAKVSGKIKTKLADIKTKKREKFERQQAVDPKRQKLKDAVASFKKIGPHNKSGYDAAESALAKHNKSMRVAFEAKHGKIY